MNNKQMFIKGLLIITIIVLTGIGSSVSANHSSSVSPYHWLRSQNPFIVTVGDNVDPAWDSYLTTTLNNWSLSSVLDMQIASNFSPGVLSTSTCDPVSGRVVVCNDLYGNNNWMGTALIWVTGAENHITQALVRLNDTYFSMPVYDTDAWKNSVMCHELGHTLGLDHQDTDFYNVNLGTCLDYTIDPSTNQQPNTHDYDQLSTIYTHLDSFNGVIFPSAFLDSSGVNLSAGAVKNSTSFGKGIAKDKNGKYSLFRKDLKNGDKLLTHVFWVK